MHGRLAHHHRARRLPLGHTIRRHVLLVGEVELAAEAFPVALQVDLVFDGDRDAVEWRQRLSVAVPPRAFRRSLEHDIDFAIQEGSRVVRRGFHVSPDQRQQSLYHGGGRQFPGLVRLMVVQDGGEPFAGRQPRGVVFPQQGTEVGIVAHRGLAGRLDDRGIQPRGDIGELGTVAQGWKAGVGPDEALNEGRAGDSFTLRLGVRTGPRNALDI